MRLLVVLMSSACASSPAPEPITATTAPPPAATPKKSRVVVTDTEIGLLDPIKFLPGSPSIDPRSSTSLDAVAKDFIRMRYRKVVIQGFGPDALPQFREQLGTDRAKAVVDALVSRGVERQTLEAEGYATSPSGAKDLVSFLIAERYR